VKKSNRRQILAIAIVLSLAALTLAGCATPVKVEQLQESEVLMEHMKMEGVEHVLSEHISLTVRSGVKWRTEVFSRPGSALLMINDGIVTSFGTNRAAHSKELSTANYLAFMKTFAQKGAKDLREHYRYGGIVQSDGLTYDRYRGRPSNLAAGQTVDVERSSGRIVAAEGTDNRGGEFYRFSYFAVSAAIPDELFKTNALGIRIPALLKELDLRTFNARKEAMETRWKLRPVSR
jgi:hypothetical protein